MAICEVTPPAKPWKSEVTRLGTVIESATYTIDSIAANGDFVGTFRIAGSPDEQIEGKCAGGALTFERPKGAPIFRYNGVIIIVGERVFSRGTRAQIGFSPNEIEGMPFENEDSSAVTESEKEARELAQRTWLLSVNPLVGGDDWIAEKGIT